jgi:hypothetical protein
VIGAQAAQLDHLREFRRFRANRLCGERRHTLRNGLDEIGLPCAFEDFGTQNLNGRRTIGGSQACLPRTRDQHDLELGARRSG